MPHYVLLVDCWCFTGVVKDTAQTRRVIVIKAVLLLQFFCVVISFFCICAIASCHRLFVIFLLSVPQEGCAS